MNISNQDVKDSGSKSLYTDGTYREKNPDWHLADASDKAQDILPFVLNLIDRLGGRLKAVDIGAGIGGVSAKTSGLVKQARPESSAAFTCYDLSESAIEEGRKLFPELEFHCGEFKPDDLWDVALLVDFLEHVGNPRGFLSMLSSQSRYFIVRQPLQENLSTYRHDNYRAQREQWGHISFFNWRNFHEMAEDAGWQPMDTRLYLAGEYGESRNDRVPVYRRCVMRMSRHWAAYLFGAYMIGIFESIHDKWK